MKTTIFCLHIFIYCFFCNFLVAQTPTLKPPTGLKASQGTIPDYIQIEWQSEKYAVYQIRRVDSADSRLTKIINLKPVTTTKFSDREALPNRKYFYAVQKIIGTQQSAFSKPVIGYRAIVAAGTDKDSLRQQTPNPTIQGIDLMIQSQTPDTFALGKTDNVWFYVSNPNTQSVEQIKLSFHLSTDNQLSDDDAFLGDTTLEMLAGNKSRRGTYPLSIKAQKADNRYFLIVSTSPKDAPATIHFKPIFLKN